MTVPLFHDQDIALRVWRAVGYLIKEETAAMRRTVLSATAVVGLVLGLLPSHSASAGPAVANPEVASGSVPVMTKPTRLPVSRPGAGSLAPQAPAATCTARSATKQVCITPGKPSKRAADVSPQDAVPFPEWCTESNGAPVSAARTRACRITGLILTTTRTVNGVTTVTGVLNMDVWDYEFSSADLPNWQHQIGVAPTSGWGAAATASVTGRMVASGDCTNQGPNEFPTQSLSPANGGLRKGFAGAVTTATAVGAVGFCTTDWVLGFTVPQYPPASASSSLEEVSCDNATGANGFRPARVGCVVWWFPALVTYSQSSNPSLASHVARAQGSGLPGATFANPLNRTFDPTRINTNRNLACGDAPSIPNMSCDEYPLATTYQGLAAGGTRRTFPGCNINAPTNVTGPTGASACMIADGENRSQGGTMAAFFYDNRVLEGDPYRVGIGS